LTPGARTRAGTTHTTTLQGTLAAHNSQLKQTMMGTQESIPLQLPTMASNSAVKFYRDSGQISINMDYAVPSLGHSTAQDLCVGQAFGQFYALDCKQPRL